MASFNGEIMEIFSKLPAKIITKFKSVCTDAKSYASESIFIKKQCEYMLAKGDSGFLLVQPHDQVQLYSTEPSDGSQYIGMPWESVPFLSSTNGIMASSNGLVCGRLRGEQEAPLFICNPVTKSWVSIPLPDGWNSRYLDIKLVFECVNADDYMLIITRADPDGDWSESRHMTRIYSPGEGVWKEGGSFVFGSRNMHGRPVYVHSDSGGGGAIYYKSDSGRWIANNSPYYWPYVVRYDMKTSLSKIVKIPKEARIGVHENDCIFEIFKYYGHERTICLIKLRKTVFSVWVLDLESFKWKMILKKAAWVMGVLEPNLNVADFTVINGNLLVIATAEKMYRYNLLGDPSKEKVRDICSFGCGERNVALHPYSNTLRPCGAGARPLPG